MIVGLSVLATGKADYVGKSEATELNGRMAQPGRGLHLVTRSGSLSSLIITFLTALIVVGDTQYRSAMPLGGSAQESIATRPT